MSSSEEPTLGNGWAAFRAGNWDRALRIFERVAKHAPEDSDDRLQATFGIANTWAYRRPDQNIEKASALFESIIAAAPKSDLAAWSMLTLARIPGLPAPDEKLNLEVVIPAYQRVIDSYPGHPAAEEAFAHQQAALVATLDPEKAKEVIEKTKAFQDAHPDTKWKAHSWAILASAYQVLQQYDKRLEALINALKFTELDPTNPKLDLSTSYWQIATVAQYNVGDFKTAREYYRKLIAEYPRDDRVFGAKLALKKMDEKEAALRAEMAGSGDGTSQR